MRKFFSLVTAVVFLASSAPWVAFAGSDTVAVRSSAVPRFTLNDAILAALQRNPDIQRARQEIERLFEVRHTTGGSGVSSQIIAATQRMNATLKDSIQSLPANDYIAGRKFLDSLVFSLRS